MDELEDRIRSWVDSVATADGRQTTADDAMERAERSGRRPGTTSRSLAVALVAAAVVAVVGGLVIRGSWPDGDGPQHVAAGPAATTPGPSTSDDDPRLLGVVEGDGTGLTPHIATSEAELVEMWTSSGSAGDPPVVDFDRHVVMALVVPRNACEMEALVGDDGRLEVDPPDPGGRAGDAVFCPAQSPVAVEPVVRPTTFLVVVERG